MQRISSSKLSIWSKINSGYVRGLKRGLNKQFFESSCRNRGTKQKSLHLSTAEFTKHLALRLGFHTFCCGAHASRQGHSDHSLYNWRRSSGLANIIDKATIYLDLIKREPLQIAERRIPRTEVVQGNSNAKVSKLMEGSHRLFL